jgi:hypothetical protein
MNISDFLAGIPVNAVLRERIAALLEDKQRFEKKVELITDRNLVFGAPACTQRCAGEGELVFALIHSGPILPELVEGGNRPVLPVVWRFCPIAKTVGGR